MKNKFEPIPTHNFKKIKTSNAKFSFIKVQRMNSKEIKPVKSINNLNVKSLEKSIKNTKIFSKSNKNNISCSNIILRKNKHSLLNKSNIKIKVNNKSKKKFHSNSTIIKNTYTKETENHLIPSFRSSQRHSKKIGPNSPICHIYYGNKKSPLPENLDDILKKQNKSYLYSISNNKFLSNKSQKHNNPESTALSCNESCLSIPISPFKNYSVENGISNQLGMYYFDDLTSAGNKNINRENDNKNSMIYFKELDSKNIKDISDNKIFLNKKEDTSLLTFGNSLNESGNNSLRGYFNNNICKENKQKNDTKKCISILQKENETLKYQLNQKNEKINSLQQKIEQLLLNEKENINININSIHHSHLKSIEQQCPLPTPYVRRYSQVEFHANKKMNHNKKIFPSSTKNTNTNYIVKNKDKTKINNNFGKYNKNSRYVFSSPNSTRRSISKINNNDSKLVYKNQIGNKG